jgi:hypothetical protein
MPVEFRMRVLCCLGYAKVLVLRDIIDYLTDLVDNHVTLAVQLLIVWMNFLPQDFIIGQNLLGNFFLFTFKSVQFRRQMI